MKNYQMSVDELKYEILSLLRQWHFELYSMEPDSCCLEATEIYTEKLRELGCTEKVDLDESEVEEIKRICEIKNKWKEEYENYWASRY
ncbi:hypothetical protein UACE39S_01743 [Ureibacillus acetophenoni]